MSDWFYKKLSGFSGYLAIAFLFGLVFFMTNIEIKDMDLWLHLAVGKYIVQNLSIPHSDFFSSTIVNTPWINHEWLFQVMGFEGLINLRSSVICLSFVFLLFLGYYKERLFFPVFILLLVLLVYQLRMTLRPDIFSILFLTTYVIILGTYLDRRWSLGILIVVQILWTNTHGFFIIGPGLALLGFISEWLKRHVRLPYQWSEVNRLSDLEYSRIKRILLFVSLACLVNPYFVKGALYPLGVIFSLGGDSKIFFKEIQELQRTLSWETILSLKFYVQYKLLILISFLSFLFNYNLK